MFCKNTINDYLTLSVSDCKRLGFLKPLAFRSGSVIWHQKGKQLAAVTLTTDTRTVPVAKLSYTVNGKYVCDTLYLRFKHSNLKENNGGYYYFVCPETGRNCRKLYLVDGHFKSRSAFRPLYEQQKKSKKQRTNPLYLYLDLEDTAERMVNQKYRRIFYRDKQTPFGCKLEKILQRQQAVEQRLRYLYE